MSAPTWLPAYLRAREREGRLLPDDLVATLPELPRDHPLQREWLARADSTNRLLTYLRTFEEALSVIDAGTGNGWLAGAIAAIPGTAVLGIDTNDVELAQAQRVFADRPNLRFQRADLETMPALAQPVDIVVLASVVQYVRELPAVLQRIRGWLAEDGEIHILDSPIYKPADVAAARERTHAYYASIGVPEMADAYHHYTWDELAPLAPTAMHNPVPTAGRFLRRLSGRVESPFPWLVIRREVVP